MSTQHVNPSALTALLERWPATNAAVAAGAEITPGHLADLKTGRRSGSDEGLRVRLAAAIGLDQDAISCWCAEPARHRQVRAAKQVAA